MWVEPVLFVEGFCGLAIAMFLMGFSLGLLMPIWLEAVSALRELVCVLERRQ